MTRRRLTSLSFLAGVGVWTGSLALYLSSIAPSLTWGKNNLGVDGGELLAAASTLGVPHPPGYPTYTLLLKLFATVVPVSDFAFRGNLMSAVLAATSVALLYWFALRLTRMMKRDALEGHRVAGAALGAAVLASSPLFWSQSILTEVYTLNALFIAALLVIATYIVESGHLERDGGGPLRKLALFAFLLGLGLGNHLTLLLVAGPLIGWLWSALGWRRLASPWAIGAFALGLAIYVYLPIRAAANPPINWGAADTFGGIAWMLSGRPYQGFVFGLPVDSIPTRVITWIELIFSQFNPLGLFIGLMAIVPLRRRLPGFLWASLLSIVVVSVYSIIYFTVDSKVFMIPALLLFSSWVAVGFFWILAVWMEEATRRGRARRRRTPGVERYRPALVLTAVALALLPVMAIILNYSSESLRNDRFAIEHARGIVNAVPERSVLLSNDENNVFSLWYVVYAEKRRTDLVPIAVPLLKFDWYLSSIRRRYPQRIPADISTNLLKAMRQIVEHNVDQAPVFFTFRNQFTQDAFDLERVKSVYRALPKSES